MNNLTNRICWGPRYHAQAAIFSQIQLRHTAVTKQNKKDVRLKCIGSKCLSSSDKRMHHLNTIELIIHCDASVGQNIVFHQTN